MLLSLLLVLCGFFLLAFGIRGVRGIGSAYAAKTYRRHIHSLCLVNLQGHEVATRLLLSAGTPYEKITVKMGGDSLTQNSYCPLTKTLTLSKPLYHSSSLCAVCLAAHLFTLARYQNPETSRPSPFFRFFFRFLPLAQTHQELALLHLKEGGFLCGDEEETQAREVLSATLWSCPYPLFSLSTNKKP